MTDSPARRLRDALEPVAALSFHSPPSLDAYASVGLPDFFPAYFWSRSSVLGVADAAVVGAAFGVWAPELVRTSLETARRTCSLDDIRAATVTGAGAAARTVLGESDVTAVTAVLRRGLDAADDTGRALFAGARARTRPDDPYEDLWHVATAWRELRGDSHLAACVGAGVSGLHANVLNELDNGYGLGEYTATRQWSGHEIAEAAEQLRARGLVDRTALTDEGRTLREDLERATDTAVGPAVDALGDDLVEVVDHLNRWSQLITERGWFPDDWRKRAAG